MGRSDAPHASGRAPRSRRLAQERLVNRREALRLAALAAVAACTPSRKASPVAEPTRTPGPTRTGSTATNTSRPNPAAGEPALEIVHGDRTGSLVALTFHGAGDPAFARKLLTQAHAAGAVVTVFAVGNWLRDQPDMAKLVLDNGHELGNHTFNHRPMRRLSASVAYDEIARCRDEISRLTGRPGVWFRPSGTPHATPRILAAAGRAGYRTSIAYDVDPRDYQDPGAAAVRSRVRAAVQPGSIVSLHLGHSGTVQALPGILEDLASKGLRSVGLSHLPGA
jgi:peptidoglycan/xylan/chitin deacetylase (PgdA/CDA1 family)